MPEPQDIAALRETDIAALSELVRVSEIGPPRPDHLRRTAVAILNSEWFAEAEAEVERGRALRAAVEALAEEWETVAAVARKDITLSRAAHRLRAALLSARAPSCWCGGVVGPRVPGDSQGMGCLSDVTHNWRSDAAPAGGAEWVSGVCESDDGPREATSHCVLPRDHAGDHCDDTGGSWHR